MKHSLIVIIFLLPIILSAQPDKIVTDNVKSVKLFPVNNQEALPVLRLSTQDQLELHFDDLDNRTKNYYYTYQLCNANWEPADVNPFDYIKGFTENRLTQYRFSSIASTKYVHYQMLLPEENCMPVKSGNYLLKVYLNGDTSQLVFTKKFFVVDNKAMLAAQIVQPLDNQLFKTHQRIQLLLNASQLNPVNAAQQIKVAVVQNYRWDNLITDIQPTFIRDNTLEFSNENEIIFPAGKEYRWVDMRSFRFLSDRMQKVDTMNKQLQMFIKPDAQRNKQLYLLTKDLNGWFDVSTTDNINNWWQSDYAFVHFTFIPENNLPYENKSVYVSGELTNNALNEKSKMVFNEVKGVYEKIIYLKQGYYSYTYVTKENKPDAIADATITDGNSWETENDYTIFVYYRSLSDRHDELVNITTINSRLGKR